MLSAVKRRNFERLLNPRHIAFVGGADAAVAIGEARRAGFAGEMWVVNSRRETLAGLPCLPDFASLPAAPDAVFVAIPAPLVPGAARELAQIGAGGIVCYSAGFGEAHEAGRCLEEELKAAVGDMVLIGPNCYGLINYVGNSALWPFAHGGTCPGYGAAIITQSGMFSSDITMSRRSLPMAYMASAGNQADIGLTELVDLLCDRPEVRAIGIHIEGLRDVPAFERAALKALKEGTPIVALKTGSSKIGERLTLSHTGSLAGSNELYRALFRRCGVIGVTNPSQLLETLKFLCVAGPPGGMEIMGFTCSGGGATMLADYGETIGLTYPEPGEAARRTLTKLLPPIATVSNPLDYTTPIWGQPEKTGPVFAEAMRSVPAQSTLLIQDYPAPGLEDMKHMYLNDGLAFAEAAISAKMPAAICATIPENFPADVRDTFVARGIAPMQGIHEALNAIRDAAAWRADRARILAAAPEPLVSMRWYHQTVSLAEAEGKKWLADAGFAVPKGRRTDAARVVEAACDIGFPVALKMMGPKLAHKTEAGAVALGLATSEALCGALAAMRANVKRYAPDAVTDDFLVEAIAPEPLAELIVGIRADPQFGLAMTLGSGGVLVELLNDAVSILLPAAPQDIDAALTSLRVSALLDGFRGRPRANRRALVNALWQFAEFALGRSGEIAEIEINPLFVYQSEVLAVDVLMQVASE